MLHAASLALTGLALAASGDSEPLPIVGIVVWTTIGVGAIIWYLRIRGTARKLRVSELAAYAAKRGWTYQQEAPEWAQRFTAKPFNGWPGNTSRDLFAGTTGPYHWVSWDYQTGDKKARSGYGDQSGVRNGLYSFSVVAVELDWEIPRTEFIPKAFREDVAAALGADELNVESDAFNAKWRVKSLDNRAAHALLAPTMIEALLREEFTGRNLFLEGGFLVHSIQVQRSETEVDGMLAVCMRFLDHVPTFVMEEYRRKA